MFSLLVGHLLTTTLASSSFNFIDSNSLIHPSATRPIPLILFFWLIFTSHSLLHYVCQYSWSLPQLSSPINSPHPFTLYFCLFVCLLSLYVPFVNFFRIKQDPNQYYLTALTTANFTCFIWGAKLLFCKFQIIFRNLCYIFCSCSTLDSWTQNKGHQPSLALTSQGTTLSLFNQLQLCHITVAATAKWLDSCLQYHSDIM